VFPRFNAFGRNVLWTASGGTFFRRRYAPENDDDDYARSAASTSAHLTPFFRSALFRHPRSDRRILSLSCEVVSAVVSRVVCVGAEREDNMRTREIKNKPLITYRFPIEGAQYNVYIYILPTLYVPSARVRVFII